MPLASGRECQRTPGARWGSVVALLVVAAGVGLRFYRLGFQSLWFDEGYSNWLSSQRVGRLLNAVRHDFSPPGYFVMLSQWMRAFGDSEWAMRSLSAVLGSGTLVLVWLMARRALGHGAAVVLAASLFALSEIQVEYSQEARPYIAGSFFFAAGLYCVMRHLNGGGWRWLGATALMGAGLVYQHNVMWFFLAGLHAFWLAAPGPDTLLRRVRNMVIADIGIALLYLPWLPGLTLQMHNIQSAYFTDRPVFYDLSYTVSWLGGNAIQTLQPLAAALGITDPNDRIVRGAGFLSVSLACVLGLACCDRRQRRMLVAILLAGLVPILMAMVYSQFRRSVFVPRAFIPASVVFPLVIAAVWPATLRPVRGRWVGCVLAGLLVLGSGLSVWGYFHYEAKENWRLATHWINAHEHQGALIVFSGPEGQTLYDYYTAREGAPAMEATGAPGGFYDVDPPRAMRRVLTEQDLQLLRGRIKRGRYQCVYLVQAYTKWADPSDIVPRYLNGQFREVGGMQDRGLRVRAFVRPPSP